MEIGTITVIGAGLMGSGIAQVAAQAGYKVNILDVNQEFVDRGMSVINKLLQGKVNKGRLSSEEKEQIMARLSPGTDLAVCSEAQVVIEAVPEKMDLKKDMFRKIDSLTGADAILATNTSSLSITEIASVTKKPHRVLGMHFFSPVPVMKLVELIPGLVTEQEVMDTIKDISEKMGKKVVLANNTPGFIVNRLLVPMLNEAFYLLMEGNKKEDIDQGMQLGANHPIGPLQLADLVGIDILLHTMESLYESFSDSKYRPCTLLKEYVAAGKLGRKTGEGVYSYR
ncbi:3-hydroxybutyryl-CoA dehydrogenase [Desulfocucumis palustris]|uniref:3-hydroxybutyryl-CoA dehydrogenase n=1 Tax=Desulfocucumis palustris TaxID=1898651 RepID=A0A2L2XBW0_9FIRM|nr:3-hydroxyacyl-CoA dehydrogenase NAD-binding domain-containing protein [Desulfocucumis palustris]GBF33705.1 3-hydroxybutyryl-CoA dehydrogenase [Desulfocucumis palustris]